MKWKDCTDYKWNCNLGKASDWGSAIRQLILHWECMPFKYSTGIFEGYQLLCKTGERVFHGFAVLWGWREAGMT